MDFQRMAEAFKMSGRLISHNRFGSGHINDTYILTTSKNRNYILQHINKNVFKNPVQVMENAYNVTNYIRNKGEIALKFLLTTKGLPYYCDDNGEYWRAYEYLGGLCMDMVETPNDFFQSGLAFGQFQNQLIDYPAHTLHETIPNFHNTPERFKQLHESVDKNLSGRRNTCQEEIDFLFSYEDKAGELQNMLESGILPLRVTHNDTKLNNVLLNPDTHEPLCVLDLDTVMPGLSAYDYGDAIRSGANTAAEDEKDVSKVSMDLELFEVFTHGFLQGAPNLTEKEKEVLPLGVITIALELASRFLKDYIDGDLYFKTNYPEHNLVRCRTQIAMCKDIMAHWDDMHEIINRIIKEELKEVA